MSLNNFTYGISYQQTGFAYTTVSNQKHFEQVITIVKTKELINALIYQPILTVTRYHDPSFLLFFILKNIFDFITNIMFFINYLKLFLRKNRKSTC